jgi:diguanylate cyclase (GGDEF)-like protein
MAVKSSSLPAREAPAGLLVAQSLRSAIETLGIPSASPNGAPVTVSIGLACSLPASPESAPALLTLADAALYRAKGRGRNRVVNAADVSQPKTKTSQAESTRHRFSQ